jgi:hypothetical protein
MSRTTYLFPEHGSTPRAAMAPYGQTSNEYGYACDKNNTQNITNQGEIHI